MLIAGTDLKKAEIAKIEPWIRALRARAGKALDLVSNDDLRTIFSRIWSAVRAAAWGRSPGTIYDQAEKALIARVERTGIADPDLAADMFKDRAATRMLNRA